MRRVVVTGMGMLTPVGLDLESTWSSLLSGHSGVGPITLFDAHSFPTRIAAEVKDFRLEDYIDEPARWVEHSRNSQIRPLRRFHGDEGCRSRRVDARSGPNSVRRVPRLGRRSARFSEVREADEPDLARRPCRYGGVHPPGHERAAPDP